MASSTTRPMASTKAKQGQRVHREAEGVHQREGADQRDRNGDERDQRRPYRAKEDEDDEHDEGHRLDDRGVDRLDRAIDEDRGVVGNREPHAVGQVGLDLRQRGANAVRDVERIGRRLLDDADRHRGRAAEESRVALLAGAELHPRDVLEAHGEAFDVLDDDLGELLRRGQAGLRQDRELAVVALDPAGRDFDVLRAQRRLDLLHGDVVGGKPGPIEPHPHGVAALAEDAHLGDAGDVLDAVGDEAVGEVGELERRLTRPGQGQVEDRLRVGLDLGDDRLVDLLRQTPAHAADAVAHVRGGDVRVHVRAETHGDVAALLAALRGHGLDAFDAGDRVLEDLRDLRSR